MRGYIPNVKRVLCLSAAATLLGCASAGPGYVPAKDATVSLRFFPPEEAANYIKDPKGSFGLPLARESDKANEDKLVTWCAKGTQARLGPLAAVALPWLIDKGVSFAVNQIDKTLQAELDKYTAAFQGTTSSNLYADGQGNPPPLESYCFRLTRSYAHDGVDAIAMDLVGRLEIRNGNVLVIRPLRLFYSKAAAATDESHVIGVSISLKMSVIWREANRGREENELVSIALLSEKVTLGGGGSDFYVVYNPEEKPGGDVPTKGVRDVDSYVALPPWSAGPSGGNWTITVITVAEAGNPPWLLKNAAKLFHDNKDNVTKSLESASKSALGVGAK